MSKKHRNKHAREAEKLSNATTGSYSHNSPQISTVYGNNNIQIKKKSNKKHNNKQQKPFG